MFFAGLNYTPPPPSLEKLMVHPLIKSISPSIPHRYKEGMLLTKHGTETPVAKDIEDSLKGIVQETDKKGYEAVDEWEVDELLEWTNGLNFDNYVSTWKEYATSATSGPIAGTF